MLSQDSMPCRIVQCRIVQCMWTATAALLIKHCCMPAVYTAAAQLQQQRVIHVSKLTSLIHPVLHSAILIAQGASALQKSTECICPAASGEGLRGAGINVAVC